MVIELYNPHSVPIRMTGWKLASLSRSGGTVSLQEISDLNTTLKTATTKRGPNKISITGAGDVILPGEKIVLENDPKLQPDNIKTDWANHAVVHYTNKSTTAANLDQAVGNELVLVRPRVTPSNGVIVNPPASNTAPENTYDEKNLIDLVPLDNLDLVGISKTGGQGGAAERYRYARANTLTTDYLSPAWHCVYPGPYNLGPPIGPRNPAPPAAPTPAFPYHHIGLLPVLAADIPGVGLADNGNFGRANGLFISAPTPTSGNTRSASATYETRPLKINALDLAGPNRPYSEAVTGGLPNGSVTKFTAAKYPMNFPAGGFARRGDLLEVPFIGSYVLSSKPDPSATGGTVYEMNSVTMDSVFARFEAPATNAPITSAYDQDTTYAALFQRPYPQAVFHNEQIGHFCPMDVNQRIAGTTLTGNDFTDDPSDSNFQVYTRAWTYHWAKHLFDYLDVFTPQDAYLPNIDPAVTSSNVSGDPSVNGTAR